jgi:hypothetical protein
MLKNAAHTRHSEHCVRFSRQEGSGSLKSVNRLVFNVDPSQETGTGSLGTIRTDFTHPHIPTYPTYLPTHPPNKQTNKQTNKLTN